MLGYSGEKLPFPFYLLQFRQHAAKKSLSGICPGAFYIILMELTKAERNAKKPGRKENSGCERRETDSVSQRREDFPHSHLRLSAFQTPLILEVGIKTVPAITSGL